MSGDEVQPSVRSPHLTSKIHKQSLFPITISSSRISKDGVRGKVPQGMGWPGTRGARIQQAEWWVFLLSQAMLTTVLLSCALLLAIPVMRGAQMGLAPLEGIGRPEQALFLELQGLGLQPPLKRTNAEQAEEALLQEAKAKALAEVSCCDPCATCYCRFFNAFCYCRKLAMSFFPELYFNVDNGYLEGLVRGLKAGVLTQADYLNLVQCETLEARQLSRGNA
ncbi:Agouti-related protein [Camelus dromedarius]|uniref:Agouti-related protein n=1 Tax=Camelus dromedarius TaxID=9838 RepID=A0A5N4DUM5_CAMDR|nr:Agouti-related protein [Camelus dromedarius]